MLQFGSQRLCLRIRNGIPTFSLPLKVLLLLKSNSWWLGANDQERTKNGLFSLTVLLSSASYFPSCQVAIFGDLPKKYERMGFPFLSSGFQESLRGGEGWIIERQVPPTNTYNAGMYPQLSEHNVQAGWKVRKKLCWSNTLCPSPITIFQSLNDTAFRGPQGKRASLN